MPVKAAIKNFDIVSNFNVSVGNGTVLCMMEEIFAIDENVQDANFHLLNRPFQTPESYM